jgi:hypothetical protein
MVALTKITEKDAVLVSLDQFRELRTHSDQLGRTAVDYEDAVLDTIAVRAQVTGDPRPAPVVGHVIGDQVTPRMVAHRILIAL